jgi:membrane protease YdiL (CAAX protease family)
MVRTALVAIGVGAAMQGIAQVVIRGADLGSQGAIRTSIVLTLVLYVLVAALVARSARSARLATAWTIGHPRVALLEGLVTGITASFALFLLARAATGHEVADPRAVLLVSEHTWPRMLAAFLIFVVAAPAVEEVLFRGLLLESLRSSGRARAVFLSAVLFSLWHLTSAAFAYYALMGALLGTMYWRGGLKSSIAAHASFNAVVLLGAVMYGVGPGHVVHGDGFTATVPAGWSASSTPPSSASIDLYYRGPSGSELAVSHLAGGARTIDLASQAMLLNGQSASTSFGTITLVAGTAKVVHEPGFDGLRTGIRVGRHDAEQVLVPRRGRLYVVTLAPAGSNRAEHDLERVLASLRFDAPTAATTGA